MAGILRLLFYVIVVAALVFGAVWLADRPGAVMLRWEGWQIDTTVPVLILGLLVLAGLAVLLLRLIGFLVGLPRRLAARRRARRRRQGYVALTDGLAAVAAGNPVQAQRQAKRADALLKDPTLTALLAAQAAELTNDRDTARSQYKTMLDRPETAFLGLRGLLTLALKEGDSAAALDYARRAYAMNPDNGELAATLFDLQAKAGLWTEAQGSLVGAARHGGFPPAEIQRKKAVVLTERAGLAAADNDRRAALKLAGQAVKIDPAFVPAALRLAGLLAEQGRQRKAAAVIQQAWRYEPHPDLYRAYAGLWPNEDPLARVRRVEKLATANSRHVESHLALGEAALDARLWGQARNHLMAAVEQQPSARAYRLLAKLEENENGNAAASRQWLEKASDAAPDPAWICQSCNQASPVWSAHCPSCGTLDSLSWATPSTSRNRGSLPVPVAAG